MQLEDGLRNFIATPIVLIAAFVYLASGMVGTGVHQDPKPLIGIAIAAGALLLGLAGYGLATGKGKSACRTILNVALIIGAFCLLSGVLTTVLERIYHVRPDEAGAASPAETHFVMLLGCLSVLGLIALNSKQRPRRGM